MAGLVLERFLANERWPAAIRTAGYAGKDYVLVAKARIAVAQKAPDALRALEAVPPGLRSNKSYLLAKVQFLRRQDKADAAAQIVMADASESATLPDGVRDVSSRRPLPAPGRVRPA